MQKALRVLIVIAIVLSLVQVFDLVVELLRAKDPEAQSYSAGLANRALTGWLVYWPSGLILFLIGLFSRRKFLLLGNSLAIGGAYLMMLGNNGGLWSVGHEVWRLQTSALTLIILVVTAIRMEEHQTESPLMESRITPALEEES
ncbi:MAG: hypothetical protein AB1757_29915 [Acidobacteriota bacterium]